MNEQEIFDTEKREEASLPQGGPADNGVGGTPPPIETPIEKKPSGWYIDLTREEFVAFRLLLARVNGPLRLRMPSMLISLACCAVTLLLAVEEWAMVGWKGYPDPVLLVGAVLVLLPGLYSWLYVPFKMKKTAGQQYDRSLSAGMDYCGELIVCPEYVEKVGHTATGHIRLDDRALFVETADMMVFVAAGSPAVVIPARCLTEEMATRIRTAADQLPAHNRRFIARVVPGGQPATPTEGVKPEEWWVSTFTYTVEEYTAVLRGLILRHFWQRAPLLVLAATVGALLFGWNDRDFLMCLVFFLVLCLVLVGVNLLLPLWRIKQQVRGLSPHELTMQVRMDSIALRVKGLTTGENWVLWCDVNHVYNREEFVEFVHNKHATLHIPKRVIPDLEQLDAVIRRCRGMEQENK